MAVGALAVALASLAAPGARAQGNYRSAATGGRSTLMGNTGTALSRDGTAPFLNPATLSRIDDEKLSFSVNFYTLNFVKLSQWFQPGPVDQARFPGLTADGASTTATGFHTLPSTLCFFLNPGGLSDEDTGRDAPDDARWSGVPWSPEPVVRTYRKFALCFGAVERQELGLSTNHQQGFGAGTTAQVQSVSESWTRFAFGPTYAAPLTERISLGASLHFNVASLHASFASSALSFDGAGRGESSSFSRSVNGDSLELTGVLGATYRASSATLALSVNLPGLHIFGLGHVNASSQFAGVGDAAANGAAAAPRSTTALADGNFRAALPMRLNAGVGVEFRRAAAEFDISYSLPMDRAFSATVDGSVIGLSGASGSSQPLHQTSYDLARGVLNGAAGGEYFVSDTLSVVGGVSTDLSAVPRASVGKGDLIDFYAARQERVAASLGLGSYGRGGELLLGTEVSYAWGERAAVNSYQLPNSYVATPTTAVQVALIIAGQTNIKALLRAVKGVKDAVRPGDKKPDPDEKPRPGDKVTGKPAP